MTRLRHPEHGEVVEVEAANRVETLLSRGYALVEDEPPAAKKKPSRTARVLPVNPPDEPEE